MQKIATVTRRDWVSVSGEVLAETGKYIKIKRDDGSVEKITMEDILMITRKYHIEFSS